MLHNILRSLLLVSGALLLVACGGTTAPASSPSVAASVAAKPSGAASTAASAKPSAASAAASKPTASTAASAKPDASVAGQTFGNVYSFDGVDYGFNGPDTIQGGIVTVQFHNMGKEPHHLQLLKFNDNVTPAQVTGALSSGNPDAVFQFVSATGGVGLIDPTGNAQVALNLAAGQYLMVCFISGPDGVPHLAKGMTKLLTVTAPAASASAVASPQAAVTANLKDFTFDVPATLPAGRTVIRVDNAGPQIHEMNILKLSTGKQVQDALNFLKAVVPVNPPASGSAAAKPAGSGPAGSASAAKPAGAAPPAGPPPFADAGGINGFSQNLGGWAIVNLDPGDYAFVCSVPDPASGQPHFSLGMIKGFSVK